MVFVTRIYGDLSVLAPVPGKFLGIVGKDPSDSKCNQLHVDIFRVCFHSFEVYSIDSPNITGNSPEVLNFNRLFLKLNRFICNQPPVLPVQWLAPLMP